MTFQQCSSIVFGGKDKGEGVLNPGTICLRLSHKWVSELACTVAREPIIRCVQNILNNLHFAHQSLLQSIVEVDLCGLGTF